MHWLGPSCVLGKVFTPSKPSEDLAYLSEGAKVGLVKATLACSLALVAVLSLFVPPAAAVNRSEGDYWLYEGEMDLGEITVSGSFRYEFEAKDSLVVGSETYDVDVLKVTGSMAGETDGSALIPGSVEMVFDGYTYEIEGGIASVREDMYAWGNITVGTGSLALVTRVEMQDVTTYSPPLLSGFADGETGTGDEWNETTNVTRTVTHWTNGTMDITSSDEDVETYSFSVAAAEETVTTDAGTFSCLKMTVTRDSRVSHVYWYSSDVSSWVKISTYSPLDDSAPYMTLELAEYEHSACSDTMIILIIGLGILVAVVVVVVVLLMMRKRGGILAGPPQQMPPPPPPPTV
ncbi:MAG TPA: hypothetical protein HA364_07875 [Thermoplasmata archaeon]|nr:hypothetical protein [Thermoplasmata archaeon]